MRIKEFIKGVNPLILPRNKYFIGLKELVKNLIIGGTNIEKHA